MCSAVTSQAGEKSSRGIPGTFVAEDPYGVADSEPSFKAHTTMSPRSKDAESLLTAVPLCSLTSADMSTCPLHPLV